MSNEKLEQTPEVTSEPQTPEVTSEVQAPEVTDAAQAEVTDDVQAEVAEEEQPLEITRDAIDTNLESVKRIKKRKRRTYNGIVLIVQILLPALVIFILLNFVIGIAPLYGASMEPTFYENDWIVYNRLDKKPEFGDIIVAQKENVDRLIIKRVIGLPGDTIDIKDGNIYINDALLIENGYTFQGPTDTRNVVFPLTLNENEYLVLGDNRAVSLDSRNAETGNINSDHILGTVVFFVRFVK